MRCGVGSGGAQGGTAAGHRGGHMGVLHECDQLLPVPLGSAVDAERLGASGFDGAVGAAAGALHVGVIGAASPSLKALMITTEREIAAPWYRHAAPLTKDHRA